LLKSILGRSDVDAFDITVASPTDFSFLSRIEDALAEAQAGIFPEIAPMSELLTGESKTERI